MTKLLEFKPNPGQSVKDNLDQIIEDDVWLGCTPDMPKLRYSKEIKVFLWDEIALHNGMTQKIGVSMSDYKVEEYFATTKESFLPFFNAAHDKTFKVSNILPSSPNWGKSLEDGAINYNPRPIQGKVVSVNLFTLRLLDTFYGNTVVHQRVKTVIKSASRGEMEAWVYTLPTNTFTKYFPHENTYRLVKGFKPAPCSIFGKNTNNTQGNFALKCVT